MEARETETRERERERERERVIQREGEKDGDKRARHSFHIKCLGYSSTKVYFIKVMPPCSKRDYLSKRPRSLSQASNSFGRTRTHALIEERKTHADEVLRAACALTCSLKSFRLFPRMHLSMGNRSQASHIHTHQSKYSNLEYECSHNPAINLFSVS